MKLVKPNQVLPKPVVLTTLGNLSDGKHIPARLVEAEGQWMTLQLESAVAAGLPVRVDVEGGLVLGTTACSAAAESGFRLRVEIDQVIPDVAGLARLVSAVLGVAPPVDIAHQPERDPALRTSSR